MIRLPNFLSRHSHWLEHDLRDASFVIGMAAMLVALTIVAPPSWVVGSLALRFVLGVLLGEWLVHLYRWSRRLKQAKRDQIENEILKRMILRARDLADLRLRFAELIANQRRSP